MSIARNPRQPTGVQRIGRTLPVPVTRDLTDDELTARMDDAAEAAHNALRGCIVCGDPVGVRCCEHGADFAPQRRRAA